MGNEKTQQKLRKGEIRKKDFLRRGLLEIDKIKKKKNLQNSLHFSHLSHTQQSKPPTEPNRTKQTINTNVATATAKGIPAYSTVPGQGRRGSQRLAGVGVVVGVDRRALSVSSSILSSYPRTRVAAERSQLPSGCGRGEEGEEELGRSGRE
jgi:hypothetical protein